MLPIMSDNEVAILYAQTPTTATSQDNAPVPASKRDKEIQQRLEALGVTDDALLSTLFDLAMTGAKIETTRDAKGNVIKQKITEDPGIKIRAIEKILELKEGRPKSVKRMYAEDIDWG